MNVENLFPIGTVVTVKEANKKMMIIGIMQKTKDAQYDYMAVLYPEGYLSPNQIYLFNGEDVAEVHFLGFMGAEYQIFRNNLIAVMNGMAEEGQETEGEETEDDEDDEDEE